MLLPFSVLSFPNIKKVGHREENDCIFFVCCFHVSVFYRVFIYFLLPPLSFKYLELIPTENTIAPYLKHKYNFVAEPEIIPDRPARRETAINRKPVLWHTLFQTDQTFFTPYHP